MNIFWNLKELYTAPNDPHIPIDIKWCLENVDRFTNLFKGKINCLNSDELYSALLQLEAIGANISKLTAFAYLNFMINLVDSDASRLFRSIQTLESEVNQKTGFFGREWSNLETAKTAKIMASAKFSRFKHYLQRLQPLNNNMSAQSLDPVSNTQLIENWMSVNRQSWRNLYAKVINGLKFNNKRVSLSEERHNLHDPNREIRRNAASKIFNSLSNVSHIFTHIINTQILEKAKLDLLYQYPDWLTRSNIENEMDNETIAALIVEVNAKQDIVRKHFSYKKKLLGLNILNAYDINAPMFSMSPKTYSWQEGSRIVVAAYDNFSPQLGKIAAMCVENDWIHAMPHEDKAPGSFSHPGTPATHPYIFLNFKGSRRDLALLAHEMGHAIHYYLSREHGFLSAKPPLPAQEIAAIFSEFILNRYLYRQATTRQEKQVLLCSFIEDCIFTLFRQAGLHLFESEMHKIGKKIGEINSETISNLWLKSQTDIYASQVIFQETDSLDWALIPHFFHFPGYVRFYAFSSLVALSLMQKMESEGPSFTDNYIKFLKMGHHCGLNDLLATLDIDIKTIGSVFRQGMTGLAQKQAALEQIK